MYIIVLLYLKYIIVYFTNLIVYINYRRLGYLRMLLFSRAIWRSVIVDSITSISCSLV